MASASSLAQFQLGSTGEKGLETIEIDPQFSGSLGLAEGDTVRCDAMQCDSELQL